MTGLPARPAAQRHEAEHAHQAAKPATLGTKASMAAAAVVVPW